MPGHFKNINASVGSEIYLQEIRIHKELKVVLV